MLMFFPGAISDFHREDIPVSASFRRESFGHDGFSGVLAGVLPSGALEGR